MKASAALEANQSLESITQEINRIVEEAESVDAAENKQLGQDNRDDALPPELVDPKSRLERLKAAKSRLEAEKKACQDDSDTNTDNNSDDQGPKGNKEKANATDPDSRIMKTRNGWVQGYNCQAVSDENQFIVATEVTQDCNDAYQLKPMLEKVRENLANIDLYQSLKTFSADAGYWCEGLDIQKIEEDGPELILATRKSWKQRQANRDQPPPRGRIPKDLPQRERMDRKLRTKRGQQIYAKRGQTIEPIFGQTKEGLGFKDFLLRGIRKVRGEWDLQCAVSNLLKLFRFAGAVTG